MGLKQRIIKRYSQNGKYKMLKDLGKAGALVGTGYLLNNWRLNKKYKDQLAAEAATETAISKMPSKFYSALAKAFQMFGDSLGPDSLHFGRRSLKRTKKSRRKTKNKRRRSRTKY